MAGAVIEFFLDADALAGAMGALAKADKEEFFHPAWDAIGIAMVTATRQRFQRGVTPEGQAWPPSQRVLKHGGKTLIDTGRLWNSIVAHVVGNSVEWGSNIIYAAIHQYGGTIEHYARSQKAYRRVADGVLSAHFVKASKANFVSWATIGAHSTHIPARPYLGVNDDDVALAKKIFVQTITARIAEGARK